MQIKQLSHDELIAWLRLIRTVNIGPVTFFAFLKVYKTPKNVLEHLPTLISNSGANNKISKICTIEEAEKELESVKAIGAKVIAACEPDYPESLRKIADFPPIITVLGDISLLKKNIIAIVGGRNSSINGRNFANKLAYDLSQAGFITISGLASGIDTAVNSIIFQNHPTIAVTAAGIDVVYPKENLHLYNKIAENNGLIITELPFSTKPKPQYFPQRNRIISGLSLGIVLIEASKRSGSLITANFALEQNKEVFAVPGSPLDPRCGGSNNLIKKGAKLVESVDDIIDGIHFSCTIQNSLFDDATNYGNDEYADVTDTEVQKAKAIVLSCIDSMPTDIDEIIAVSGVRTEIVLVALLELELAQKIERYPGNKVALVFDCK
ncbi:MAG: DNA processing protein DprA [Candidatus Mesenet longicola]|uniref:DNA processing protein DprA n=1 Tax=Candidatus Mesenet longicola TaxID=1892558 RepID=A0A8J3MN33_9RICK|nr:MAG: DNA processing protein DprA [Candidatus Mesenet longicola]GHM59792.1 MAG: DNA processing protein DprA [Candidatus Mesenet longicola]